ncbi:unnamed protein product [Strongylus vulgaris]|uniref:Uncharacterized protein n=1 Tax=Strongylus vulgaris TaxID=40348 RepID=A0A3P7IFD8_STRVU|nr:unnamed protein product [Strongylus vulgaris]
MRLESIFYLFVGSLLELQIRSAYSIQNVSSISELNTYFESFFATSNSTELDEWLASLPTHEEKDEMRLLLAKIYRMKTFDKVGSSFLNKFENLKQYLNVTIVQNHYCVIHELIPDDKKRFERMWGYVVIASKKWAKR